MEQYANFIKTYGTGVNYGSIDLKSCSESDLELIPKFIHDLLNSTGVSSFIDGFLWTIHPNDLVEWLNDWLPFSERCIPFARTAMADVLFIRNGEIMLLNSNWGLVDYTIDDDSMFFDHFLTNEQYLDENFNKSLFNQLKDKNLNQDECFGFTPLLSLGGAEVVNNLSRLGMKEYLDIVSKSNDNVTFFKH